MLRADLAAGWFRCRIADRLRRRLQGQWEGKTIVGIRLNWDKRYITLAPIATVLGLAFKLYDPDHLIGDKDEYGITAALIPTDTGRRRRPPSLPAVIAFQNGPNSGKDVFVPLDYIIGGQEMAGKGWKMLVELLSVGRAITLPSSAAGGGQAARLRDGRVRSIRKQFNTPIANFEGVGEALTRIAGHTYIMNAACLGDGRRDRSGREAGCTVGDSQVPLHGTRPQSR